MEATTLERTLTELDHVRLLNRVRRGAGGDASTPGQPAVEDLLDGCAVVPSRAIRPDVVTMYSQVLLRDVATGRRDTLTLCYPEDAEPAQGFVSVLSPAGMGLLGLQAGSVARWRTPAGEERAAEIVAILFQPESTGDYTL